MNILRKGKNLEDVKHYGKCATCDSIIEADRTELTDNCFNEEDNEFSILVSCPHCGKEALTLWRDDTAMGSNILIRFKESK